MKLFARRDENILEGKLLPKIIYFVLPLMLTNLLQVLYNAADMVVVGLSDTEGALGSIGTTGAMINLILNIFMGFSIGTNVVVAKNIGKGDREATEKAVHTSLLLGLFLGIVCMIVGIFISRPTLALLGDQGTILDLATKYTVIYFIGVPFISLTNYLIAIFRAKGDTMTPLYILTATGLLNVGLNLLFVLAFKMDVDGVAWPTVISNIASTVLFGISLSRSESWCKLNFRKLKIDKTALKSILFVGLPAGVQGALFSLSNMLIQSSIITVNNTLCPGGSDIIDGNTAASSLEGFAYTAQNSVYQAAVTFASQHYGAKKYERIKKVIADCYLVTFVIAFLAGGIIILLRDPLVSIYSVRSELAVKAAMTRIFIMMIPYFTLAFMETGSGILRGLGKSLTSTIVSLVGICILRVLWIFTVFAKYQTLESVFISYPLSWTATAAVHFTLSMIVLHRLIRNSKKNDVKIAEEAGEK